MKDMIFSFPMLPPSVNSMFYSDFRTHSRHKSEKYRKFIKDVEGYIPPSWIRADGIKGDLDIELNFYFDTKRKNDIDNRIKPTLDTLVHFGIIEDDSSVKRLLVEKYYEKGKPETVIRIRKYVV